jgi:hypothetical protein
MALLADLGNLASRIEVTLTEWAGSLGPWLGNRR